MSNTEINIAIGNTIQDFIDELSLFKKEQINIIPFEGSWTPGQLAQHIILSLNSFAGLLNGPVKDTDRPIDQHVAILKSIFLNFEIKMQSPPGVIPAQADYDKNELLAKLESVKAGLNQTVPSFEMDKTCVAAEIPTMGYLTRTEIAHFILYHTQRHTHQLKKIYHIINNK